MADDSSTTRIGLERVDLINRLWTCDHPPGLGLGKDVPCVSIFAFFKVHCFIPVSAGGVTRQAPDWSMCQLPVSALARAALKTLNERNISQQLSII